jgi:hypothetical protein
MVHGQARPMNLKIAQTLVAWLWAQHPEIIDALARQAPRKLGQCISCDIDWLSQGACYASSSVATCDSSFNLLNPSLSLDPVSLDPSNLETPQFGTCALVCIPTLTEADLTPIDVSSVTGPTCIVGCGTSVTNTDAKTSSALNGVAGFLTSAAGLTALTKAVGSFFQAQTAASNAKTAAAQAQIIKSQIARAAAGQAALPIAYVANGGNGTTVPVISTTGGYVPLTSSILSSLTPSSLATFFAQYGTWVLVGGATAFLLYAASSRRRQT